MNEHLEEKLIQFNADKLMMEAVKAAFNRRIEMEKPMVQSDDSNELLGEKYRAYEKAKEILNKSIIDIQSYQYKPKKSEGFNKGR